MAPPTGKKRRRLAGKGAKLVEMSWEDMLEKRILYAHPDSQIVVDTQAKKVLAEAAVERLRPYDGLKVVIDEEPLFPWWIIAEQEP
jgi:hypothetical protein